MTRNNMADRMLYAAAQQYAATGGASVDNLGQAPVFGYMVADNDHTRTWSIGQSDQDIAWIGQAHAFILRHTDEWRKGRYFGMWVDSETGTLYLDVVDRIEDRNTALANARRSGEIAIWDVKAGEEIRVA